jgi:LysR family glycine cleavage system transcriptional activator
MSHDWRTFPSLTALRAFDATARFGNFARAARALNVTDAAVSQQVRSLEDDLGVKLAIRQGRTIELTEPGRSLARSLATAFDEIGDEIASLREGSRQRAMRATTTPYLTDHMIVPRLAGFWAAHPGAEISLSPRSDYVDVVREGFDVGIQAHPQGRPIDWPGTDVVRIADVPVIAIASPSAADAADHDVQKLPWLWHDGMETKEAMMRACGVDVDHIQRVPIGSPNLLLEATRQGLGATLFNGLIGKQLVEAGGLVEVDTPNSACMTYYAVLPKGPRHPLSESFVDWIRSLF